MKLREWIPSVGDTVQPRWTSIVEAWINVTRELAAHEALVVVAANGEKTRRTYADLLSDVGTARRRIRAAGDQPVVATIAENSYPHVIWILAAWLEGRSLCPINPAEGAARIKNRLEQLHDASSVWTDRAWAWDIAANLMDLAPGDSLQAKEGDTPKRSERPLSLIFTSGSTGYSKIVELTEAQCLANAEAVTRHHRLGVGTCIATPLPIFHVNALKFSLLSTILNGGRLVLFERFSPPQLMNEIEAERAEICSVVPHILKALVERPHDWTKAQGAGLRYFVTAASALSPQLARRLVDELPIRVIQGYGLSEAVNFSCLMPTDLSEEDHRRWFIGHERPSIGCEVWGNQVAALDEAGRPLGEGQPGELAIRGLNVMTGYRGDRERRVFAGDWLHTGDLGYFVRDKRGRRFWFISGRVKDIAKRFGQTVSLVEIDDCLSLWPDWGARAIAVPFTHDVAGEEIAVIVQAQTGESPNFASLVRLLEEKLPEHLRPHLIAVTRAEVRTASGKPRRWPFQDSLARWRGQIFGRTISVVGELEPE